MKIRVCDICGEEIPTSMRRHRFTTKWFSICTLDNEKKVSDICQHCFEDYRDFVKMRRREGK